MGRILVGICSWTDPALAASGWYPPDAVSAEARLRHYAGRFPMVEVDATYYALPSERNSRLWVERTPPGFTFDVKAFSLLTGHPTRAARLPGRMRPAGGRGTVYPEHLSPADVEEVWQRFLGALAPLHEAGRLGAVLLQLPPWFRPGRAAEEYLLECRRRCAPYRVSVELRSAAWFAGRARSEATLGFLRRLGLPYVCVDMPQGHASSVPPVAVATSPELSLVRFHGRSAAWASGDRVERFRYRYEERELREWVPRILRLAEQSEEVHVLVNTCCGDAAPESAAALTALLRAGAAQRRAEEGVVRDRAGGEGRGSGSAERAGIAVQGVLGL